MFLTSLCPTSMSAEQEVGVFLTGATKIPMWVAQTCLGEMELKDNLPECKAILKSVHNLTSVCISRNLWKGPCRDHDPEAPSTTWGQVIVSQLIERIQLLERTELDLPIAISNLTQGRSVPGSFLTNKCESVTEPLQHRTSRGQTSKCTKTKLFLWLILESLAGSAELFSVCHSISALLCYFWAPGGWSVWNVLMIGLMLDSANGGL